MFCCSPKVVIGAAVLVGHYQTYALLTCILRCSHSCIPTTLLVNFVRSIIAADEPAVAKLGPVVCFTTMYTFDLLGVVSHNGSVPVVLAQLCMLPHNCVPHAALSIRMQIVHACVCDNLMQAYSHSRPVSYDKVH